MHSRLIWFERNKKNHILSDFMKHPKFLKPILTLVTQSIFKYGILVHFWRLKSRFFCTICIVEINIPWDTLSEAWGAVGNRGHMPLINQCLPPLLMKFHWIPLINFEIVCFCTWCKKLSLAPKLHSSLFSYNKIFCPPSICYASAIAILPLIKYFCPS